MENGRRRIKRTYQPAKLFQPPEMATTVGLQNVLPLLFDAPADIQNFYSYTSTKMRQ